MSSSRNISQNASRNGLVRVCDDRHILRETDKAIQVRIGQTLYGEPITTFYPKSLVQILYKLGGGYDIYVPTPAYPAQTIKHADCKYNRSDY